MCVGRLVRGVVTIMCVFVIRVWSVRVSVGSCLACTLGTQASWRGDSMLVFSKNHFQLCVAS